MELLVSTDGERVIKVHAGGPGTGDPDAPTPTNANPLGAGTHMLVNQLALPSFERELWVLLTSWGTTGFKGELMRVVGISGNGYLIGTVRTMLNADTLQAVSTDGISEDENDDTGFTSRTYRLVGQLTVPWRRPIQSQPNAFGASPSRDEPYSLGEEYKR